MKTRTRLFPKRRLIKRRGVKVVFENCLQHPAVDTRVYEDSSRRGRRRRLLRVRLPAVPQPFDYPGVPFDDRRKFGWRRAAAGFPGTRHRPITASVGIVIGITVAATAYRAHRTVRVAETHLRARFRIVFYNRSGKKNAFLNLKL